MAPKNLDYILDTVWLWTAVVYVPLGLVCLALGYLERPFVQQVGTDRKRQIVVFLALVLESLSIEIRAIWCISKIRTSQLHPSGNISAYVIQGAFSRVSESLQYTSCLLMVWQWALLCSTILGWDPSSLRLLGVVLITFGVVFCGYYLGTAEMSYNPDDSKAVQVHNRYDDVVVSCFFTLSAFLLLFFSRSITNSINCWNAINLAASGAENASIRSARRHSKRLNLAALALAAAYLIRAGSWSVSTITNREKGPYPWFYPLCFYQIPMTIIAVATMCIVGNFDHRFAASIGWLCPVLGPAQPSLRVSVSPTSPSLRVSYVKNCEGEPMVELEETYARTTIILSTATASVRV